MSDDGASFRATVAILTFNGETYLRQLLESVLAQEYDGTFEVLVIDSGSTDSTLRILEDFPSVRVHTIPNSEFGHGRTRNLAAQLADSTYIAFLTQDAIPIGTHWLTSMLAPFALTERVVAVFGKQVPRPDCFPLLKYEIEEVFRSLGPAQGTTLVSAEGRTIDQQTLAALGFYSDVNSATIVAFLRNVIPYRDVRYAEDQLFGRDIIAAGYIKAYSADAAVEHSNDLTLREYGMRIFDETIALREIGDVVQPLSRRARVKATLRGVFRDTARVVFDGRYSAFAKLGWLVRNPAYHIAKWRSISAAAVTDLTDEVASRRHSLEDRRKRK